MSGGAFEYVMGIIIDQNGKPMSGRNSIKNSGFNGTFGCPTCDSDNSGLTELTTGVNFPSDTRYYDAYESSNSDENYQRRILGDATGEMGPFATAIYETNQRQIGSWYQDESYFITNLVPWFFRGGSSGYGLGSGIFYFTYENGSLYGGVSFRVVLSM